MSGGRSWTVLELIRWTTDHFASRGIETPRLDAEVLLAHALGTERVKLYIDFEKPVEPSERAVFRELVRRRADQRVPVAQLCGSREFWSRSFRVSADVLIPRPDTETLVDAVLTRLPSQRCGQAIADIGTGSGVIALSLALELPDASVIATDISPAALQIARSNADELQVDCVSFREGSLYEPLAGERFDVIVSNPPYLAKQEAHALPPELDHEPEQALFGGADGYAVLRPLIAGASGHLLPGGLFAVEVGLGQAEEVAGSFAAADLTDIETVRDLAGHPRVVLGRCAAEI